MSPNWLTVKRGHAPLLLSIPHAGTVIPQDIAAQLQCSVVQALADTDWYIPELYAFAAEWDITIVKTDISRIAIDMNRDPSGQSLYPGQATTELCPSTSFAGEALYSAALTAEEIARRKALYFEPYHQALRDELARLRQLHPQIVIFDAHSIRSVCPRLFDGELPGLNLGSNDRQSCSAELAELAEQVLASSEFGFVHNGRFKGGWITRHYGQPAAQIHGLQLEIAQRCYMDELECVTPVPFSVVRATALQHQLQTLFTQLLAWAKSEEVK
ncbi:N-formylglutamate deformylase [Shewanella avicenniae]|uniref:N-formylglutamate deformylase n=1 Tax=Shewanella avicenniae TaxID=2814294 RepID=A0ABX7QRC7_9GAMM|nr:N-formylglutamate deformylase [Shewanella avicenniae]QSX33491.1 N-formylglutamate deformylase [Shewanella avicenniae]